MLGLGRIFGKQTIAGVDIGSRFIKVVQAEAGKGCWRILRAAVGATPPDSVRDGVVVNRPAVAAAIRELFQLACIDATGAVAAISGTSVIVRHVKMPKMPESVLRKSVRFEAGKFISSSVEDSLIEFEITGPVPGEADKMGVMLVAAPSDMVESRLLTLSEAGVEPVAVDIEAFALQRALLDLSPDAPGRNGTLALLDIGASTTDVNIVTGGQFALTRTISIAGDNFTQALKSVSASHEWADLEAFKAQADMTTLLQPDAADPDAVNLARAIQPVMDELLREVRRSMNYYQSQLTDANSNLPAGIPADSGGVSQIVITGGSAKLGGLASYMAARLGTPVDAWNVFDNPALDTTAFAPSFLMENFALLTSGVGLALKELTEAPGARAQKAA